MHMVKRNYWIQKIEEALNERSIVWLSGVRRVGKTTLCQSLEGTEYLDCELPSVRNMMADPEDFLESMKGKKMVLDEIHRLKDPSELLKIAADHYPSIQIVATGSSILSASAKFRDTLAGRKREIWLLPMILNDLKAFGNTDLKHRFLFGGLPPYFLASELAEKDYQEWMDAFWAKDIQELFKVQRRYSFQKFFELVLIRSGGIFEATKYAAPCEVTRVTISNYLKILEATSSVHIIKPFSSHKPTEIVSAPKVYGFDTGFVCFFKGWEKIRQDDLGILWEHIVLNELLAHTQTRNIHYWKTKQGAEIDFIIQKRKGNLLALECKWSSKNIDLRSLSTYVKHYPNSDIYIVANDVKRAYSQSYQSTKIHYIGLSDIEKIVL